MFRFRQITLNLVYFFNILLIFLLVFEDKVQLPVFLQVTGRMHPLVLHFPLVLLFLGIFLEWLTSKKEFNHPATRKITVYIFYLFAIGAATAALFGFFLYKEGSYQGEEMGVHKWMGTAVSLLAVVILWVRESGSWMYYGTLTLSAIALTLAGHQGAEVTHGNGFLTEPIRKHFLATSIQVEHVDSAVVFRDVIQPILNEKCLNCHNTNKAKNDLILSDYESLVQGGDDPHALVAGNAGASLVYKYITLPIDDSLHMPPKEKLQLDPEEIKLIGWWINSGANPQEKYVNYSKVDSIHPLMLSRFQPKSGLDLLEISFPDQQRVKELNNPYRTVQQISTTKPYVAVFLGSKKDFSEKDLNELKAIGRQVISIDLGNSRVRDNDLKLVTQFPHLQKIHLQNTPIGDEGIQHLKSLQYLEVLNVSGTKITARTLSEISQWKSLKKLYIYNTSVSGESLQSLRKAHQELEVFNTQVDLTDSIYNAQLTIPVCKIDSLFFRERALVEVKLSRGKVKYYYTLDGSEPDAKATVYAGPFQVDKSCEFKIIATMDGWTDSKVASFQLLKIGLKPDRITFETKPHAKHAAKLDTTFFDGNAGGLDRNDKAYIGFSDRNVRLLFQFDTPRVLSQVAVSFLADIEKGIFPPDDVEVWGGSDRNNLKIVATIKGAVPEVKKSALKGLRIINFPEQRLNYIRLQLKRTGASPSGSLLVKNGEPSIFIDEVSMY